VNNSNDKQDGFRSTLTNSFFKTNRSTAMSSNDSFKSMQAFSGTMKDTEDNAVSDLVSNTDQLMVGTPMALLRGRQLKKQRLPIFQNSTLSGDNPKDINSLLKEFH
jgi:hypothetical protein